MKKIVILIICICCFGASLAAGPFIKIHSVDAESDFPRVSFQVSARDTDGNWISGLDEDNLLVYEDGYRVNYVQVSGQSKTTDTLYLVFSLDSSKSISKESFTILKKAAVEIITASDISEQIALCRFNDKVVVLENFSGNKHRLISAIEKMRRHGSKTMLYNAIYDSIELVSRTDSGRKAIVIFTDGKDEGSSVTLSDIVLRSRETGIPLYVISMSDAGHIQRMKRMTKLTGGKTIQIDKIESIVTAYKHVIQNIKSQHLVKYISMAPEDGKPHQLEVRLKYDSIRDREIREFTVSKSFFTIDIPEYEQILLIIMILLFILFLGVGIVFLAQRRSRTGKPLEKKKKSTPMPVKREEPDFNEDYFTASQKQSFSSSVSPFQEPEKRDYEVYSHAWLILQSNGRRKKFPLSKDEVVIGTSNDAHLVVKNTEVSPHHCSIKYVDGTYYLFDLVSQTGTFLNGKKLLRPRQLFDWDEITIGPVSFIFRGSTV